MHAVRKRILEILKEQMHGATVAELAEQLDMAPVSVRHHLDILQGDNLICVDRLERKGNVGRPQQVYTLTEEADSYFPNNFAALSGQLIEQIKQMLPPDQVPCAFRSMAQEMAAEFPAYADSVNDMADGNDSKGDDDKKRVAAFEQRLEEITTFLNERGYLARWETVGSTQDGAVRNHSNGNSNVVHNDNGVGNDHDRDDEGYIFLLHKHNCPYAGVSAAHTELCLMDQTLITELTGQECERVASMAEGASCCTYRVAISATEETGERSHPEKYNKEYAKDRSKASARIALVAN